LVFWQSGFDTAQIFCDEGSWSEALAHIGCAFETAEIILISDEVDRHNSVELMTSSAVMLAFTLLKLGRTTDALDIYWRAIWRLEGELAKGSVQHAQLQKHLGFLYRCVENLNARFLVVDNAASNMAYSQGSSIH
jgi:hypothetical protein|tara:strand:+ start:990 stop:1394 length:405 start_codon:yes stop_codon:yes gene_type:complete